MIFTGADTTGFEEDARLTAMWLWTLSTGGSNGNGADDGRRRRAWRGRGGRERRRQEQGGGFVLEYDAARKIAQGLGAHLEASRRL